MAPASDIFDWSASDHYMLLAVSRDADADAVHKAFRKLAKLHHPDRYPLDSPERKTAAERFKALAEAHDVLCDPARRATYDASLDLAERCRPGALGFDFPTPPPPPSHGADAPESPPEAKPKARFDPFADDEDDASGGDPDASFAETLAGVGNSPYHPSAATSASYKSAATAYYAQGLRYYGYGEYARAMRCFLAAMQLDPSRRVPPQVMAKLTRYAYGWD